MRFLEGSCKAKGRLYPSLLSLQAHGVGAKAAGGASRDSDTALCFQARPSFQVSRINPTANECSPSPYHLLGRALRAGSTRPGDPRGGGRLGGWGSLLPPLSPAAKSWGWCPLSPSDSLAGALQAESGAPRATRPPESRREIAPTLGTS